MTEAQPAVKQDIATIADKHEYDIDQIDAFLDIVFEAADPEEECILTWMTKGAPGYPMLDTELLRKLKRVPVERALYFGTSTTAPDPRSGKLFNRKSLFKRFFVLVLDDIGTKVKIDKLPPELKPTYIIETSKGNFQYGYVLEEPIDELVHAELLVQLIYDAGFSDDGGKMATKLVRLPDGVNGKPGRLDMPVKLIHMSGPKWTPAKLLEVLDIGVTWKEVLNDAEAVIQRRANISTGTSSWAPIKALSPNLDGTVDDVLEWMLKENMVKQEAGDWVTIECPWSDEHSSGGATTAGYSPMGRGIAGYASHRSFKCFHAHCSGHKTSEFLEYIAGNGGPARASRDLAADLVATYAYDPITDSAWKLKDVIRAVRVPLGGFKHLHPHKSLIPGTNKAVADTTLWLQSENKTIVWGQTNNPATEAKIVTVDDAHYINTFLKPHWGVGGYEQDDVDKFKQFIGYLIPSKPSADYFLDWLACKAQDMSFRGAGIIMVAKAQGTGRTTLADMIRELFLPSNVETVPYEQIIGGGAFNEWMTNPIVVANETLATPDDSSAYKAYERLKEIVDPRPIETRINPKYGQQRVEKVHSSFLFMSNHAGAIAAAKGDRRLYVLNNAVVPESSAYFGMLNEWLDKKEWMRNVWRWLQERDVDFVDMMSGAPMTMAKEEMLQTSQSLTEQVVRKVLELWPSPMITTRLVKDILAPHAHLVSDMAPTKLNRVIGMVMKSMTMTAHSNVRARLAGKNPSIPRLITAKLSNPDTVVLTTGTDHDIGRLFITFKNSADDADIPAISTAIGEFIHDADD